MSELCHLIVNPTSGNYSEAKIKSVRSVLLQNGLSVDVLTTGNATDATRYAHEVSQRHQNPFILVAGGDGTINGVLNGVTQGTATLALLPMGTANVLANELNITSLDDAAAKIIRRKTESFSAGMVKHSGGTCYFSLMTGVGFDGAVVKGVRLEEKRRWGKLAYLFSALRAVWGWDKSRFTVTGDNGQSLLCHSVIASNCSRYGGNFILAPEADIFTPGFTVLCINSADKKAYVNAFINIVMGNLQINSDISVFQSSMLSISGHKNVQVDGDYCCSGPITISSLDNFAKFVV